MGFGILFPKACVNTGLAHVMGYAVLINGKGATKKRTGRSHLDDGAGRYGLSGSADGADVHMNYVEARDE